MLLHRVITSIILILIVGVAFFLVPESVFIYMAIIFFAVSLYELLSMYHFNHFYQFITLIIFIIASTTLCFIHYDVSQIVRFLAVIFWCFVAPFTLILQPKRFTKVSIAIFGVIIFVIALYSLVILHVILGAWQLLSIMAIAWVADIGAYFVGRKFGRHKLSPKISPGKSIEGAIAALLCVIVYLSILKYYNVATYLYSYLAVVKFAIILVSVSVVGDLLESWFKRVAGVKDSGSILPGHGGLFDRVDSLVAVLAIAFAMIRGFI